MHIYIRSYLLIYMRTYKHIYLDLAAENGHINTVMTLVVKKRIKILPRPRNCHYSILNMALFERYEQFAMILINSNEVNVNENEKNDRSTTPLHIGMYACNYIRLYEFSYVIIIIIIIMIFSVSRWHAVYRKSLDCQRSKYQGC